MSRSEIFIMKRTAFPPKKKKKKKEKKVHFCDFFKANSCDVAPLLQVGDRCGLAGVPGVYVRVAHYRSFIENS